METLQNSFDKYFGAYGIALVILAVGIVAVWVYNLKKDKKIEEKDVIIKDIVTSHTANIKLINSENSETVKCLNKENVDNIKQLFEQHRQENRDIISNYHTDIINVTNVLAGVKTVIEERIPKRQ